MTTSIGPRGGLPADELQIIWATASRARAGEVENRIETCWRAAERYSAKALAQEEALHAENLRAGAMKAELRALAWQQELRRRGGGSVR